MLSRIGVLTLLAMLGILLVFFFPASSGPFSVTNGPATAFRALDAARGLFASMSAALLVAVMRCAFCLEPLARPLVSVNYDPELFAFRC
jgi:hypothetical protein